MSDIHDTTDNTPNPAAHPATRIGLVILNRIDLRLMGLLMAVTAAAATVGLTA